MTVQDSSTGQIKSLHKSECAWLPLQFRGDKTPQKNVHNDDEPGPSKRKTIKTPAKQKQDLVKENEKLQKELDEIRAQINEPEPDVTFLPNPATGEGEEGNIINTENNLNNDCLLYTSDAADE